MWSCLVAVGSVGGQIQSTVYSPDPLAHKKENLRTQEEEEGEETQSWGFCSQTTPKHRSSFSLYITFHVDILVI